MIKNVTLIIILVILATKAPGQNFLNPDLNGIIVGAASLPTNWQNVPFTDINCQATSAGRDSPDLTDLFGPSSTTGILGNPYSGNTFVSGVRGTYTTGTTGAFQEGIMQTVTGFIPNTIYTINFQQSVVRQISCLDQSGSWAVYIDNNLAGITLPTFSSAPYNSTSFIWESRSVSFTATANSHTIKFLPHDDDLNLASSTSDTLGALRMGIDSIYVAGCNLPPLNLGNDTSICSGQSLLLDAGNQAGSYLWQDGSTNSTFNAPQTGTYWVVYTEQLCSARDTIVISTLALPSVELGNDTTVCGGEALTLAPNSDGVTLLWSDMSTGLSLNVQQGGQYSVIASNICGATADSIIVSYEDCSCLSYVPNAFTPQGDGINEAFRPVHDCEFESYRLQIFDRWGELLFDADNAAMQWEGTYKGRFVPDGVYIYVIEYTSRAQFAERLVGHVSVLR